MSTKLLFCVDHLFQQSENGTTYTTGGKFPYSKWLEYIEYFDELTVVARGIRAGEEDCRKLAVSSGPRVRHVLLDSRRGVSRLTSRARQNRTLRAMVAEADAVIGRLPSEIGMAACGFASRMNKPYLLELVGCPWDALWNRPSMIAKAYAPVMVRSTRAATLKAPLVHYVTREFLQRRYPTSGQYVCASNVMLPVPEPDLLDRRTNDLRAAWPDKRPIVFGTIGSMLTNLKGIDVAIKALAQLRDRIPPFTYRVLGEGDPTDLSRLAHSLGIGGQVSFDGLLPGATEVAEWLDGVQIYLQPSYQEGLPRAMIEAMNRACLVIGSTAGGIGELIPPERMHAPGDVAQLAARIEMLLGASPAVLENELSRNFTVAQRYSYERSIQEKRRAYRALRTWLDTGAVPQLEAAGDKPGAGSIQ